MKDAFLQTFTPLSDGDPIANGAIGLIALATDQVCEHDVARIPALAGVPHYLSRVASRRGYGPHPCGHADRAQRRGGAAAAGRASTSSPIIAPRPSLATFSMPRSNRCAPGRATM